jgi:hypothetical protein
MILSVYGGAYSDGHFVGSPKEQITWTTRDLYKPLPRYYSETDLNNNDLRGITRLFDDENDEVTRDHDIYEMAGADTIKPGRAAMIYEPIQNIMIPIVITHNCINGCTFLDEFNEKHYTTNSVYHPLTRSMNMIVHHRSAYTISKPTPDIRSANLHPNNSLDAP